MWFGKGSVWSFASTALVFTIGTNILSIRNKALRQESLDAVVGPQKRLYKSPLWRESRKSLGSAILFAPERKVWTLKEQIPAKGWGPQGYGKYNRKQTSDILFKDVCMAETPV